MVQSVYVADFVSDFPQGRLLSCSVLLFIDEESYLTLHLVIFKVLPFYIHYFLFFNTQAG